MGDMYDTAACFRWTRRKAPGGRERGPRCVGRRRAFQDDLLAALGLPLEDAQARRLRAFGYGCDPKERLAELQNE